MSQCHARWFLLFAFMFVGIAHAGQPAPRWLEDANTVNVGELTFRECLLSGGRRIRHVQCANLEVPEDYTKPDGRRLSLFIVRLQARSVNKVADPLLAISGGPGQAASESFLFLDQVFYDLVGTRDIYLIDQRGTGFSRPQHCGFESLDEAMLDFDLDEIRAASRDCLREFDGDPRQYTTSVAIRDFETARKALGVDAWNLYGVSYGTRVAQQYMRRYPSAIRAVMLDGVVPMPLSLGPDIALQSQAALDAFFAFCAADAVCSQRFPDLKTHVNGLLAALETQARPVEYEDMKTGELVSMSFTRHHLLAVLRFVLYNPEVLSVLPSMLHKAYALNDYSHLARMASLLSGKLEGTIALGMHNAVLCSEDVPYYQQVPLDALNTTYMGAQMLDALRAMCADWPVGVVDADLKQPLVSVIPTLLLSGERDPITPPAYAEQVREGLAHSRHLVAPGQGHGVAFSGSGCMPRIVARFVEAASVDGLQTECLSRLQAPPVFVNVNGPSP